ncbi:Fc.00g019840.m01.CDS01 [Cosmosporella sp. VM-42]
MGCCKSKESVEERGNQDMGPRPEDAHLHASATKRIAHINEPAPTSPAAEIQKLTHIPITVDPPVDNSAHNTASPTIPLVELSTGDEDNICPKGTLPGAEEESHLKSEASKVSISESSSNAGKKP